MWRLVVVTGVEPGRPGAVKLERSSGSGVARGGISSPASYTFSPSRAPPILFTHSRDASRHLWGGSRAVTEQQRDVNMLPFLLLLPLVVRTQPGPAPRRE